MSKLIITIVLIFCYSTHSLAQDGLQIPKDTLPFFMDLNSVNNLGWSSKCSCFNQDGTFQVPSKNSDTCTISLIYWKDSTYKYQSAFGVQEIGSRMAIDTILLSSYKRNNDHWMKVDYDGIGKVINKSKLFIDINGRIVMTSFDAYGNPIFTYYYFLIDRIAKTRE